MNSAREKLNEVTRLFKEAFDLFEEKEIQDSLIKAQEALNLLPEPKTGYREATIINIIIANSYLYLANYPLALKHFLDARNCPNGVQDETINFRIG